MRFDLVRIVSARTRWISTERTLSRCVHAGAAQWRMAMNGPGESIAAATVLSEAGEPPRLQRIVCGVHVFFADESPMNGGRDAAPSPFGYLIAGLGACTSMSLRAYAGARKWRLGTIQVVLELRRHGSADYIERSVLLSAPLTLDQRAELAEVCETTPVTVAVKFGIAIHTRLAAAANGRSAA